MKSKKFLIVLLLVSFCSGEETQAEICENYVSQVDYIHKYQYKPLVAKYNIVTEMYLNNELSQALAKQDISSELPEMVKEIVNDFVALNPNIENLERHKKMIEYVSLWEEGLTILEDWVETKDKSTYDEGSLLVARADFNFKKYYVNLILTCPTD